MTLNVSATAQSISDNYTTDRNSYTPGLYTIISTILDAGFQQGTITPGGVDISTVAGTLNLVTPLNIGIDIANYWAAAVSPGPPVSCAAVVSVSNDAAKIATPIYNGLVGLGLSAVPEITEYENFVSVIYTQVKTIIWTVSEATPPPCKVTYSAKVI